MNQKTSILLVSALCAAGATAQDGLYSVGIDAEDSLPLNFVLSGSVIYDDNVNAGSSMAEEDSFALNPSIAASFVRIDPQTTLDVFVNLGLIYYLDAPNGIDELNSQSRAGVNLTHRFSERLRYVSRNFISYELEPDYAYGYASSRVAGEYFYWSTDHSVGYRWTERLGTYTGFSLTGTTYTDVDGNDRFYAQAYNQFRYQLTPQTVLTADYRYGQAQGDGNSSDSTEHYMLGGVEHRFSPNTVGILKTGAQIRDVDDGDTNSQPYLEFALRTRVNQEFSIRTFARYGMEYMDTVQSADIDGNGTFEQVEYDDRETLRFGLSSEYIITPKFTVFAGVDYIHTDFASGRSITPIIGVVPDQDEDLINANIGLSIRFTDFITGTLAYNYTDSVSDIQYRDYDRNRISLGVSAQF